MLWTEGTADGVPAGTGTWSHLPRFGGRPGFPTMPLLSWEASTKPLSSSQTQFPHLEKRAVSFTYRAGRIQ